MGLAGEIFMGKKLKTIPEKTDSESDVAQKKT